MNNFIFNQNNHKKIKKKNQRKKPKRKRDLQGIHRLVSRVFVVLYAPSRCNTIARRFYTSPSSRDFDISIKIMIPTVIISRELDLERLDFQWLS